MSCSIGSALNEECSGSSEFKERKDFSKRERKILKLRTGCADISSICEAHYTKFHARFTDRQKRCSATFSTHTNASLRDILYEDYKECKKYCPSLPLLIPGKKICGFCKMYLNKKINHEKACQEDLKKAMEERGEKYEELPESETDSESESSHQTGPSSQNTEGDGAKSQDMFVTPPEIMEERLDASLKLYNQSPLDAKKLKVNPSYASRKAKELTTAISSTVQKVSSLESSSMMPSEVEYYEEMIQQLKKKFSQTDSKAEKFQILSVLPASWTVRQIEEEFGVSNYMARAVKQKVEKEGILCTPNPRPGRTLPENTEKLVVAMYEDDRFSRVMPGAKDYKSVRKDGKRVHVQKRLLLLNLRELYNEFLSMYSDQNSMKISFSKFAELRPPHCVLPGASGTHTVCVCTIHQNFDLMLSGSKLSKGCSEDQDFPPLTMKDCFKMILCDCPQEICYFGECEQCPGYDKLEEYLELFFHTQMVEEIIYKQWTAVDRCSIETFVKKTDDFIDTFIEKLKELCPHDFVSRKQAKLLSERKKKLNIGEVFVVGDFSMNYHPVCQDAAQSFHWNNNQITIHPFVCYYRESEETDKVNHLSYVIISDWLTHDTAAVYAFQKKLVQFLKNKLGEDKVKKIIYSSDGARSQYKNQKNVMNLCYHKKDFGVDAEWHFSATAHGKVIADTALKCYFEKLYSFL